ncbi:MULTISPECIES: hypothetical protein [Streptomyces]|uniref:hypothetical protein n=1 Tax=Streptomyces TaxID=1883 RepID=UPI000BD92AFE|nr:MULTISPECIES: hypothetical protein [Streptomyces]MDX2550447.1 hypothetical protein [Streptomyces stelliscabiei]MDX2610145.1 hypothetical protein [Streptomyces stelliscabiei]MDX2634933.1 hypothetical protein [Streptomyces stelliscabiei]MDX2659879.1 hypothetical protein [Streptomyces stelliscabiei]MDX2711427.1 hypothetical protein [Streptomyces stelliscabiei]
MNGLRAVVVCLVIACAALVSPAAAATPTNWSALPVPAAAPPVTVTDLAARGPGEAWATGHETAADGLRPVLYRWNGTTWSRDTTFPGAGEPGGLGKVQFVGQEVWIFRQSAGEAEILRRSAGGWTVLPVPRTLWTYQDFTAVPGAAWVVGEDDTGLKILRYDGSGWTEQSAPDGVLYLMGITARTATDAWAWADTSTGAAILRWDGTAWRDADVPLPPDSNVHSVLPEPSGRVTIGGSQYTDGVARTYLMTWNRHTWRTTHPPLGDASAEALVRGPDGALWLPVRSDRAFQSKYARVDGARTSFSYGPERRNAIDVKPRALAKAGSSLLSFGTAEIYGSKPNLMSERLGG